MANLPLILEGRGPITISDATDHVATGGEGRVFRKANTIIKVYLDPAKMRRDGMDAKIAALKALQHDYVVAPRGLVFNKKSEPVGFYMDFVDGEPMSRMFTNAFRLRTGFSDEDTAVLVDRMRQVLDFAHQNGAVVVDPNELNWLAVGVRNPQPRIIDVDSWAIGHWRHLAVMPSIRDWHAKTIDEMTDWFGWGIVTFQLWTGIHPYKGSLDGYKPADLEQRMKANASVFAPGVRLNTAVRDFSGIPSNLLEWYRDTFQRGLRCMPPSPYDTHAALARRGATVTHMAVGPEPMTIELLWTGTSRAIRVFPNGIILSADLTLFDLTSHRELGLAQTVDDEVIRIGSSILMVGPSGARKIDGGNVSTQSQPVEFTLPVGKIVRYENRLFTMTTAGLTELVYRSIGARDIITAGQTWGVSVNSTRWFDGVGVMDALGAAFVIAPFDTAAVAQVRVPELDHLRPVAARAGNHFISVIALNGAGEYKKVELFFDAGYYSYRAWVGDAPSPELNLAILPRGVTAAILDDAEIVIYVPKSQDTRKIQDRRITADMQLAPWGDRVLYIKDGIVGSIKS